MDDLQAINSYDGALGQPLDFARLHQHPVGAMASTTTSNDDKFCSGTLIGPELYITAGHCIDSQTVGQFVAMNYELAEDGSTVLAQDYYKITEVVEEGGTFDYAVLRLDGFPGYKYGWAMLRTYEAAVGEKVTVIQHPSGGPKKIEVGHVKGYSGSYLEYADLDTEPGSSGSGIIDSKGYLIGIHTNGGCVSNGGENSGTRLNAARDSQVLSRLANVKLPFEDGASMYVTLFGGDVPHFLSGDVNSGEARLDERPAQWTVSDLGDGSFRLKLTQGGRSAYLDGRTATGTVKLREDVDAADFGSKWRIVTNDEGRFVLRTVGQGTGGRWLTASPDSATLSLQAEDTVEWEIVVR